MSRGETKYAAIGTATSGNNTLKTAVTGKRIRVLALLLMAGVDSNIYFTTAAGGPVIFGHGTHKLPVPAKGGFVLPYNPEGWFQTAAGELLNMNADTTGPFSGGMTYCEVEGE